MRAHIYVRQSLDKAGDELGIQRQEAECRRHAELKGYDVVQVITDNSVSASRGKRPGYERLLRAIENREVDVVVVLRLDRLLRRVTELEALIELSERTGVLFATVQGDLSLENAQGRLLGRILASVARSEVETKSERHKLANQQKATLGKPHGSRRPYGYEPDLVTIRESEAEVIRDMARRVIAGSSYKHVAHWLNQEGHTTTFGKPFYPITVRNLLRKKRYAGIREYKGAEYPAVWPAILDGPTWEHLQLRMSLRVDNRALKPRKYLLTGLLVCGKCGLGLTGGRTVDRPGAPVRRVYSCRGQRDTGLVRGCGGVRRNADALDHFVREAVLERFESPELGAFVAGGDDAEARQLLEQRQLQQLRLDQLLDDYATGLLSRDQLKRTKVAAESELQRIDKELAMHQPGPSLGLGVGATLREAWHEGDDTERRQIIELVVKQIVVNPGVTKPYYELDGGVRCRFDPALVQIKWSA